MKQEKAAKPRQLADSRGQSFFKHTQISWTFSETYGLSIAHIRCGICLMPLESVALRIGSDVYLVCEEGHLLGNEKDPHEAKIEWARRSLSQKNEVAEKKQNLALTHKRLILEVAAGKKTAKELLAWESAVPIDTEIPHFTNRQDYNNKLEGLAKEFKESHFQHVFQHR